MSDYETSSRIASLERTIENLQRQLSDVKTKLMERQKRDDSAFIGQLQAMVDSKIKAAFKSNEFNFILADTVKLPLLAELVATEEKLNERINRTAVKSADDAAVAAGIMRQSATSAVDFLAATSCRFARG